MPKQEPPFNGPEDFERLRLTLPTGWEVEVEPDIDGLTFDFPLPSNLRDSLFVSMQAVAQGSTFEVSKNLFFDGRTVDVDGMPGHTAEQFLVKADWPIQPEVIDVLRSIGELILDQTSLLPPVYH